MKYEEFEAYVKQNVMHETIYDDSEGRRILVIKLLDAYSNLIRMVKAEREACAMIAEGGTGLPMQTKALEVCRNERTRIAQMIRARGEK